MVCRYLKTSSKKLQVRFKSLETAHKSQLHQLEEKAQFHNELWAITQKECWDTQKKVIQQGEEIVKLKSKVKQLKRDTKLAMSSLKYFENRYYYAMSVISKYDMIVVDNNVPESPSFVTSSSSSSSSFSSSSYDQIFVADSPNYINNNNNNKQ
ncbi:hypothetical protein C1646_774171 [Rhizophagus diaphanus]|nr:hypothetical protein C1646_774171 [Rhizophagus diaphanus] [Rhizophagus sp. MUCL 43196]